MVEQQKNYISEAVLEEANGDPRSALNVMAINELMSVQQGTAESEFDTKPANKAPKDVWSLMDDI